MPDKPKLIVAKEFCSRLQEVVSKLEAINKDAAILDQHYKGGEVIDQQEAIIYIVCEHFQSDSKILFSRKRRPMTEQYEYSYIIICYALARYLHYNQDKIAEIVNKDRSNVSKAIKKVSQLSDKIAPEAWLLKQIAAIDSEITKVIN